MSLKYSQLSPARHPAVLAPSESGGAPACSKRDEIRRDRSAKLEAVLHAVRDAIAPYIGRGAVADYIPALAEVDPRKFGLAVVDIRGRVDTIGDALEAFSIQSISKVFTLALALDRVGDALWRRVGREPSGSPFNSIVQLENERGVPRNPFINSGALVVTDALLDGKSTRDTIDEIADFIRQLAQDDTIEVDEIIARSENQKRFRNASLTNFMKAFGNIDSEVDDVLDTYFHQCAIRMNCVQLAKSGLFLAASGTDPLTGRRIISEERARRISALMLTCGHYDASGDFAFRVGLPGKSGVGGGILAIAPGRCAIAAWSPCLNEKGNSLAGTLALEELASRTGWSIFHDPKIDKSEF